VSRRLPPPAVVGSADDAETQFYEALQLGDIDKLMAVWADDEEIVCVHPGGARTIGPAAVRAGFVSIFASGGGIPVQPEQVHRMQQIGSALHHLVERITVPGEGGSRQDAWVLATNFYVKTALGWRLAAHHASPAMPHDVPLMQGGDPPSTLH
jgi:uncharacterized protein (TIGR02246 family)